MTRQIKTNASDVQRAGDDQHGRVAVTVVAQPAGELAEHHAAHRAAETDQARQRADGALGNHVGRQNHHQRGPRLLAEEREAENENHPADGMQLRHEHDPRHQGRAGAEREFARRSSPNMPRVSSQLESPPPTRQPTPEAA